MRVRNMDTERRLGTVEITGHSRELGGERSEIFLDRARLALRAQPRTLVVHLVAGVRAEAAALARLVELQRLADGQGTRLMVRSTDGCLLHTLALQGMDGTLLAAA